MFSRRDLLLGTAGFLATVALPNQSLACRRRRSSNFPYRSLTKWGGGEKTIDAAKKWQGTGFIIPSGSPGDNYWVVIVPSSTDQWSHIPTRKCTAAGCADLPRAHKSYALPNSPEGGLVGKIGSSEPFFVGLYARISITALASGGELSLICNDDLVNRPGFDDNSGSIRVSYYYDDFR